MRTRKGGVAEVTLLTLALLVIALAGMLWVESTPTVKVSGSTGQVVACYAHGLGGKVIPLDWLVVQKGRYDLVWVE